MFLVRRAGRAAVIGILLAAVAACGADNPRGTIGEDDLPSSVEVRKITHHWAANQVTCQDVNDAEDDSIFAVSPNFDRDKRAAVSFDLSKGSTHERLGNSVWRLSDPKAALAKVSKGLDACVAAYPENYQRIDSVEGYPDALGYTAQENSPPEFTRRILVPLEDRVVILSVSREGSDDYSVRPDALLKDAIAAAHRLSGGSTGSSGY